MATEAPRIDEVPAAFLSGRVLDGGWTVGELAAKSSTGTGGHFSVCYTAENVDGRVAFMKALNFNASADPSRPLVDQLSEFTSAYVFERDLLSDCSDRRMSHVVRLLGYGEIEVEEAPAILRQVPYLLLEMADGDVYAFQERSENLDASWFFQVLKHALEGIAQLHASRVAHQDLKPSNVLTHESGLLMKIGDLGRADRQGAETWWTNFAVPGAVTYAPPEQQYGYCTATWEERRAADLYLAGSLGAQLFLGSCMSTLICDRLPEPCRPAHWRGGQVDLMPHLQAAHAEVLELLEHQVRFRLGDVETATLFTVAVGHMTNPDPVLRGHPKDRSAATSSFSVRRFVSLMDRLSRRARVNALASGGSNA